MLRGLVQKLGYDVRRASDSFRPSYEFEDRPGPAIKIAVKKLAKSTIRRFGYDVEPLSGPRSLGYDYENQAYSAIKLVEPYTMIGRRRLITLYHQVAFCEENGIPGDLVECGVWKGGAVALMAMANLAEGKSRRHIHLFDAFTEICAPDQSVDGTKALNEAKQAVPTSTFSGELVPLTGIYHYKGGPGTLEGNKHLLEDLVGYDSAFLHYHKGWFQETLPLDSSEISQIAILRLDGDWYASTKVCLEYLYDKVSPGGIVIVDDYGCYEGCKKAVDEFRSRQGISAFLHYVDQQCRYWIKP